MGPIAKTLFSEKQFFCLDRVQCLFVSNYMVLSLRKLYKIIVFFFQFIYSETLICCLIMLHLGYINNH